jgi:hypothetical protein
MYLLKWLIGEKIKMTLVFIIITITLMLISYIIGRWRNPKVKEVTKYIKQIEKYKNDLREEKELSHMLQTKLSAIIVKYNSIIKNKLKNSRC